MPRCTRTDTLPDKKSLRFCRGAYDELLSFPKPIVKVIGYQLGRVEAGLEPDRWEWFATVGEGVRQLGVKDATAWYRTMYVTSFPEAIYVLHCFQKKTDKTPKRDIDIARARLSDLTAEHRTKGIK